MSLELDIHALRGQGLSFSQIGVRVGLTKDQVQKRYQSICSLAPSPIPPPQRGTGLI